MRGGAMRVAVAMVTALSPLVVACGGKPAVPSASPPVALHLSPACDVVPAAGLVWLVETKPRAIAEVPDLIPVIGTVVPEARFRAYAAAHGGIDPRQVLDLCVGRFKASSLVVARVPFDAARLETAFVDRANHIDGRTVVVARPPVVRLSGDVLGEPQHLTMFARELVAVETGKLGALRAAEAFAQGKLRRATPALRSSALASVAATLGDAPVRVFVPGPFEGEVGQGLGGLLAASTAVGAAAWFAGPPARIGVRVVLAGGWGDNAQAAADRLAAAAHVLSETALGRLLGVNEPVEALRTHVVAGALVLETTIDGRKLARGLHDALDAEVGELLGR